MNTPRPASRRTLRAIALLLIGGGAACSSGTNVETSVWNGSLQRVGAHLLTGTVGAVAQGGRTSATIQIRKGTPGGGYVWRIETGTCEASGEIQGGAALFPILTAGPSGSATANAGLPAILKSGSAYTAKVALQNDVGELVACAELEEAP